DPGRVRRFPPAALDRRSRRIPTRRVPAPRGLPQRRRRLRRLVGRALLRGGDGMSLPPSRSWRLEHAANTRLERRAQHAAPPRRLTGSRARRLPRVHLRPGRRAGRLGALKRRNAMAALPAAAPTQESVLDARIPAGPIEEKWDQCRYDMKLVNPANRRKHTIIVVGSGLAGAAAAATLGEQGYHVRCFTFHDTPRRAHSIAAQGGINAAKNYRNDGDSVFRLFYDTVKGGDFRAREGNAYRLAQVSVEIIDQCVAQGVPFARDY